MNKEDIKNSLPKIEKKVEKFFKENFPSGIIVKEFAKTNVESRPDYAIFLPDRIIYIEIKGSRDNDSRLDRQMHLYKKLADQVFLILDKKFDIKIAENYSKMGIGVIYYRGKKKDFDFTYFTSKFNAFEVTDNLKLLFSEELKFILSSIENSEVKLRNQEDRIKVINAVFSRFEIKNITQKILYNRFKYWESIDRPATFNYKLHLADFSFKIFDLEAKKNLFIDFINKYSIIDKDKKLTIGAIDSYESLYK